MFCAIFWNFAWNVSGMVNRFARLLGSIVIWGLYFHIHPIIDKGGFFLAFSIVKIRFYTKYFFTFEKVTKFNHACFVFIERNSSYTYNMLLEVSRKTNNVLILIWICIKSTKCVRYKNCENLHSSYPWG